MLGLPKLLDKVEATIMEYGAAEWVAPERVEEGTANLADLLDGRLSAKSNRAGFKSFRRQVQAHANQRNGLLYAGPDGWPTSVKDVDQVIRSRKNRALTLVKLYCLLFPHSERAVLIEQATVAFVRVIADLKRFA